MAVDLIYMSGFMGLDAQCKTVVGTAPTTAWRLVLLEGGVASAASYPAWSVAETSRPKALVFLSLWWLLSGIKGEPSDLPIGF